MRATLATMNHAHAARSTTSISELAREHGISPAALRLYEARGLLDARHVTRGPNGYRRYSALASERVRLVRLGQLVGFGLEEMATTLAHWDDGRMPATTKKRVLRDQLGRVRARIDELRAVEAFVVQEIEKACADEASVDRRLG